MSKQADPNPAADTVPTIERGCLEESARGCVRSRRNHLPHSSSANPAFRRWPTGLGAQQEFGEQRCDSRISAGPRADQPVADGWNFESAQRPSWAFVTYIDEPSRGVQIVEVGRSVSSIDPETLKSAAPE